MEAMTSASIEQAVMEAAPPSSTPPVGAEVVPVVTFNGIENFNAVMSALRAKLQEMVNGGMLTVETANRLVNDLEYSYFQQLVRVSVSLPQAQLQ